MARKTIKFPPIRHFIGDKQVTKQEVIKHLNKIFNPEPTEKRKNKGGY